jgi:hypothetical protein
MRSQSGTLLIDALLDRLGSTQASALLVRLDDWMSQRDRDTRKGPVKAMRRRADIKTHNSQGITASRTRKDQSC